MPVPSRVGCSVPVIVNESFWPARRHHQLAEHVRRLLGVDARLEVRVGADRVEVAQDDRAQVGGGRHVLEDLLHHPLGPRVRRGGCERVGLDDLEAVLGRVQAGRAREQHPRLAELLELVEELQRLGDVVAVVLVGLLDRLRHHDPGRHVDGRVEVGVLLDDPGEQRAVGDVALVEDPVAHEDVRAGEQRVEDHRGVPGLLERLGGDRTDVAGAAGDEDLHWPNSRRRSMAAPQQLLETSAVSGVRAQTGGVLAPHPRALPRRWRTATPSSAGAARPCLRPSRSTPRPVVACTAPSPAGWPPQPWPRCWSPGTPTPPPVAARRSPSPSASGTGASCTASTRAGRRGPASTASTSGTTTTPSRRRSIRRSTRTRTRRTPSSPRCPPSCRARPPCTSPAASPTG